MSKVLIVILNKDNAEGLKACLRSLVNQTAKICRDFDVLVVDGGSRDDSLKVVEIFSHTYPCIKAIVQRVKGGVGPARIEAIKYAKARGYDIIIWGDSENVYGSNYVESMVSYIKKRGCDIVSGKTIVNVEDSIWSKLFFWYHSLHLIHDSLTKLHAPGNNKAVKVGIYNKAIYPPSSRSDDYYFTYLLLRKGVIKHVRVCHNSNAKLLASIPKSFNEVIKWQKARVKGIIEGALILRSLPPLDTYAWLIYASLPFILALLLLMGHQLIFVASTITALVVISIISYYIYRLISYKDVVSNQSVSKLKLVLLALIGMYIHGALTLLYLTYFLIKAKDLKQELSRRVLAIVHHFRIREDLMFLKKSFLA